MLWIILLFTKLKMADTKANPSPKTKTRKPAEPIGNGASCNGLSNGNSDNHSNHIKDASSAEKPCRARSSSFVVTTPRKEVPVLFHEPYVETGFRTLHQPWAYYFKSIFQLHNESMNVWTHMLATVLMGIKLWRFSYQVDFVHDPYTWPLLAGMACAIFLYICSSFAHCLQSKSELIHYTAFMVDYAGIGIYGLGSVILHLEYCSAPEFYERVHAFFIPVGSVLAFSICFCCTVAKIRYRRPYPFARKIWQMIPVASIYLVLISPIVHRFVMCALHGDECHDSISSHVTQICWFITSGIFFASDFPQRLKHGLCDFFFHSHQIFHVAIMMCTLVQMDAVYLDFVTRRSIITERAAPTLTSAFGPVILVILCEFMCITAFHYRIKYQLEKDKKSV